MSSTYSDWIELRLPVWAALSDLFRDSELQTSDHDHIADVIRSAGLDAAQAEAILMGELAPVFLPNLLSIAGEWTGWSQASVREAVTAHLRRGPVYRWLARASARASRRFFWDDWTAVARRLHAADASKSVRDVR